MQISLKQNEIIAALTQYVAGQGIVTANKSIKVEFKAGRGASGLSAVVNIDDADGSGSAPVDMVKPLATPLKDGQILDAFPVSKVAERAAAGALVEDTVKQEAQAKAVTETEVAVTGQAEEDGFTDVDRPLGQLPEADAKPAKEGKKASLFA